MLFIALFIIIERPITDIKIKTGSSNVCKPSLPGLFINTQISLVFFPTRKNNKVRGNMPSAVPITYFFQLIFILDNAILVIAKGRIGDNLQKMSIGS